MTTKNFRVRHGLEVDNTFTVDGASGDITGGDLRLNGNEIKSSTGAVAITLSGANTTVNGNLTVAGTQGYIYSDTGLALTLDGNNVEVAGNLTVQGTTTTLNTADLLVEDKNIIIGNVTTPTNTTANNGGITLKALADKTITWTNTTDRWQTNVGLEVGGRVSSNAGYGLVVSENNFESNTVSAFAVGGTTGDATLYGDMYLGGGASGASDLILNSRTTGNASQNASISVERGDDTNTRIRWNESTDIWQFTNDGSTYFAIPTTSNIRSAISVSDTGGDGSLSYDNSTGIITYTGPSATEVRAHFTAGTGVTITNGQIAIGQAVGTSDSPTFTNLTLSGATISTSSGNLTLAPNGASDVYVDADTLRVGDSNAAATITTNGTGDLTISTNAGTNSGTFVITAGANGNLTATPNGTGNFAITASNGGNLTNTRNYVFGAIRDSTTQANGDMWSFTSGTGAAYRGITIDNSALTTKRPGVIVRSYSGGASNPRNGILTETSRGTAASPTALQQGDFFNELIGTGRTSTGWVSDLVSATPGGLVYYATENWVSTTNLGSGAALALQPTATTLTTGGASRVNVIDVRPEALYLRADSMAIGAGKTSSFTATGCSTSGTTLTIGTVTAGSIAVGQVVQSTGNALTAAYIVANISGSGNGSTWTLSQTQTTLSGITVNGFAGNIGTAPSGTTVDMLRTTRLMDGTLRSATNAFALENDSGTDFITITSAGRFRVIDPAVSANLLQLDNPTSNAADDNMTLTLQQNSATASDFPIFNFYNRRTTDNINFTPTQSGDVLGGFKMNGQYATSTTASIGMPTQIRAVATQNWDVSNQGSGVLITVNKKNTTSGLNTASFASDNTIFQSDNYEFRDSSNTLVTRDKLDYTRTYGEFAYTNAAGFDIPAQNTIYAMPLDTTLNNSGVTISNTSRININVSGWYKIIISLQATLTVTNQPGQFDFWLRKNGNDVANSKTQVDLLKDQKSVISMDWLVNSNGSDYWEIVYVGTTANYADIDFPTIAATTTPYVSPVAPALLVNVISVGA